MGKRFNVLSSPVIIMRDGEKEEGRKRIRRNDAHVANSPFHRNVPAEFIEEQMH